MKRFKKMLSVMLAVAMTLAMSVTAFAADTDSDPSPASTQPAGVSHTYEIYQIFTGDYANGVLSNIKWGKNGTGKEGDKVAEDVLDALEAVTDNTSDTAQLAVIQQYAKLESTPIRTGSETTYTDLTPGYYFSKRSGRQSEWSKRILYALCSAGSQ